jgi:hypothetical protein
MMPCNIHLHSDLISTLLAGIHQKYLYGSSSLFHLYAGTLLPIYQDYYKSYPIKKRLSRWNLSFSLPIPLLPGYNKNNKLSIEKR